MLQCMLTEIMVDTHVNTTNLSVVGAETVGTNTTARETSDVRNGLRS